jgi:hypothetical protein
VSLPPEVLFHRALQMLQQAGQRPLTKWDFDSKTYPLLRQIQDGVNQIFNSHSAGDDGRPHYLDFVDSDQAQAFAFGDGSFAYVALSRPLIDELLQTASAMAAAEEVLRLLPDLTRPAVDLGDVLFFLGLQFVVFHEVGHHICGHVPNGDFWAEFSEVDPLRMRSIEAHINELQADSYAIDTLCENLFEGGTEEVAAHLINCDSASSHEALVTLLAASLGGTFLIRQRDRVPPIDPASGSHPPLVLRHQRAMTRMQQWITAHNSGLSLAEDRLANVMSAVGVALDKTTLRVSWDRHVDSLDTGSGKAYLAELAAAERASPRSVDLAP